MLHQLQQPVCKILLIFKIALVNCSEIHTGEFTPLFFKKFEQNLLAISQNFRQNRRKVNL